MPVIVLFVSCSSAQSAFPLTNIVNVSVEKKKLDNLCFLCQHFPLGKIVPQLVCNHNKYKGCFGIFFFVCLFVLFLFLFFFFFVFCFFVFVFVFFVFLFLFCFVFNGQQQSKPKKSPTISGLVPFNIPLSHASPGGGGGHLTHVWV